MAEAPRHRGSSLPFKLTRPEKQVITSSINGCLLRSHAALELATGVAAGACSHDEKPCCCNLDQAYLEALAHANQAYKDAVDFHRWQEAARAEVYRGHCFRGLGEWKLAHECYVRGASVRGGGWAAVDIEALTRECQDRMDEVAEARRATGQMVSFRPVEEHVLYGASAEMLERIADTIPGGDPLAGKSCWIRNAEGRIVAYRWEKPQLRRVEGTPYLKWSGEEVKAIDLDEGDMWFTK
ncbi:hypothetical protein ACHAQH_004889 [Verticillium albo-atrum]